MLARRVCALAAAQRHASRAASRPSQRWTRLHSSSSSSSSRSAIVSKPSAATSATAQKLASEQAPPPTLNLDGVSDRELIRRLLTRPQRTWMWLFGSVFVGVTLMAFGPELKVGVSKHTADVASKSLQDETLQGHTRVRIYIASRHPVAMDVVHVCACRWLTASMECALYRRSWRRRSCRPCSTTRTCSTRPHNSSSGYVCVWWLHV